MRTLALSFGDQAIKAVSERVNILETFSKTASRSEVKLRQQSKSFLFEGARPPSTGWSGRNRSTIHSAQRQLCKSWQQVSTSSFQPQILNQCTFQERVKLTVIQEAPTICSTAKNTRSEGAKSVACIKEP